MIFVKHGLFMSQVDFDFDWIHYHLGIISSQIIECKIFALYDFLEINSL